MSPHRASRSLAVSLRIGADGRMHPWGTNLPGVDNRQLALNIVHWLTGALR